MSEQKVIVAGWCTVDPKKRAEGIDSFKELVLRARRARGCLDFAIAADPVEPSRINTFELWRSEEDLNAWRAVARHPKKVTPLLRAEIQKHTIEQSGPPFARRRRVRPR